MIRPAVALSRLSATIVLILIAVSRVSAADMADDLQRGEYLARAANCAACHTAPEGKTLAGGLPMKTPMGVIYATNITPDAATGIGSYSLEEFGRAVRRGVAKDGHNLYPAMPYPSYAKMTDEDVRLLYGYFLKSVAPVEQPNRPGEIKWPLNMRWPLGLWNLVFNRAAPHRETPGIDPALSRGAYLVEGPGHCGACHTPRGIAFQEKGLTAGDTAFLAGAALDNWSAPNLRGDDRAGLGRWSNDDLAMYLKGGHNRFGSSFGTMTEVINGSTQHLSDGDIAAMVKYLKSLPPRSKDEAAYAYSENAPGPTVGTDGKPTVAAAYSQKCGSCHSDDGKGQNLYIAALAGNPSVMDPDATSLINILLNGSIRLVVAGVPDQYKMPQFRRSMTDQEVADMVGFIRTSWGNNAKGVTAGDVATVRAATDFVRYKSQILTMQ